MRRPPPRRTRPGHGHRRNAGARLPRPELRGGGLRDRHRRGAVARCRRGRRRGGVPGCPGWRAKAPRPRSNPPGDGSRGFPRRGDRPHAGLPRPDLRGGGLRERHRRGAAVRGRVLGGARARLGRGAVPPPRPMPPVCGAPGPPERQPRGGGPGCPGFASAPCGVLGGAGRLRAGWLRSPGGGGDAAAGGLPRSAAAPGWPPGGGAGGGPPAGAPLLCGGAGEGAVPAVDEWRPWVLGLRQDPGPASERAAGTTAAGPVARPRGHGVPAGRHGPRGQAGDERRWSWRRRRRR